MQSLTRFLVGPSTDAAVFVNNSISLLIIFFSIFLLGSICFNRLAGLLACPLMLCYHNFILFIHYYTLDVPLAALSCLTVLICVLVEQGGFQKRYLDWLLAVVLGVGIASKHMYAAFMGPCVALLGFFWLQAGGYRPIRALKKNPRPALAVTLGCIAGGIYHLHNWATLVELVRRAFFPMKTALKAAEFHPYSAWYLTQELSSFVLGHGFFLVGAAVGFLVLFLRFKKAHLFLLAWLVWGFFMLMYVIQVTVPYYFYPLTPALALVSFSWVGLELPQKAPILMIKAWRWARVAIASGLALTCLGYYTQASLGTYNPVKIMANAPSVIMAKERLTENPFAENAYWGKTFVDGNYELLPYPQYWPVRDILKLIADYAARYSLINDRPLIVQSLTNYEWMTTHTIDYMIWQNGLNNRIRQKVIFPITNVKSSDFLISKTKKALKDTLYYMKWAKEYQALVDGYLAFDGKSLREKGFVKIASFPLPDGSEGAVWANKEKLCSIDLLEMLEQAEKSGGGATLSGFDINGDSRSVIFHHPPVDKKENILRFHVGDVRRGKLTFGIALNPDTWSPQKGDGVRFVITVQKHGDTSKQLVLFDKYIDPKNRPEDRRWQNFAIDLDKVPFKDADMLLKTSHGPGNNSYDHAGWSNPRVVFPCKMPEI